MAAEWNHMYLLVNSTVGSVPAASLAALWFFLCRLCFRDLTGVKATRCVCILPLLTVIFNPMLPSLIVLAVNHSLRQEASQFRSVAYSGYQCWYATREQFTPHSECRPLSPRWSSFQSGHTATLWGEPKVFSMKKNKCNSPENFVVFFVKECLLTKVYTFEIWSITRYEV